MPGRFVTDLAAGFRLLKLAGRITFSLFSLLFSPPTRGHDFLRSSV